MLQTRPCSIRQVTKIKRWNIGKLERSRFHFQLLDAVRGFYRQRMFRNQRIVSLFIDNLIFRKTIKRQFGSRLAEKIFLFDEDSVIYRISLFIHYDPIEISSSFFISTTIIKRVFYLIKILFFNIRKNTLHGKLVSIQID